MLLNKEDEFKPHKRQNRGKEARGIDRKCTNSYIGVDEDQEMAGSTATEEKYRREGGGRDTQI